jgi:hypothetical protein
MTDKFADLEEPKFRRWVGVVVVALLLAAFFVFRWSGSTPNRVAGVVEATGPVSVARVSGATREVASVRLGNGLVVSAPVASGGPLSPGDKVILLEEPRFLVSPAYQVVGKDTGMSPNKSFKPNPLRGSA